jgi:diguanylate cyclase (GGDEF)-like protein
VTTLTFNVWLATASALLSVACSFTAMRLALRVASSSYTRDLIWLVFSGATAVGFGLWCADTISVLAFSSPVFTPPVMMALLLAIPVAAAAQISALLFLTVRRPSLARMAISGTVAALGISLSWSMALQATSPGFALTDLVCAVAVGALLWTTALALTFRRRERRRVTVNCAAVLIGSLAVLTPTAVTFFRRQGGFGLLCGTAQCDGVGLLALALMALGSAALIVTSVITVYGGRLEARARRSATELDEVHARLQYLATHDSLTGLPNWMLFKERLAQAVSDTERPGRALAVVVIDLDRFRSFNHSLGHGAGDWLLTEVSRRIGMVIRPDDTFARLGSDEFVVLIDHVAARVEAKALTTRILEALEQAVWLNGTEVYVRPSIGVSVWPDDGRRVDDLLAHAEAAMAVAKKRGGNSVEFFRRGMTDSMQERLELENDLRRAVAAGEFELWFQPELSTRSGRIAAAEAMLRWRHPVRGVISPASFIPLAEETGLMIPLGEWVIREVCRIASKWQSEGAAPARVAVNLSATQFRHQNLLEVIRSSLETSGLSPSCLEVELTESAVMTNPEDSAGVLKQLRRMGVTVAIDDFGVGYSSLSYLRRFPIDKLKIDRSFVRDLPTSTTDESIVRAIISLAHSVSLQVVAEGVETEEQLEFVRKLGCDLWQGFYCCEPQPAEVFAATLADRTARPGNVASIGRTKIGGC